MTAVVLVTVEKVVVPNMIERFELDNLDDNFEQLHIRKLKKQDLLGGFCWEELESVANYLSGTRWTRQKTIPATAIQDIQTEDTATIEQYIAHCLADSPKDSRE